MLTPAGYDVPLDRRAPLVAPSTTGPFTSRIETIGVRLPERRVATDDLMRRCRPGVRVDLEARTGIRARRVCGKDEDSLSLAVDAARDCLSRSRYRAADLDVVISCSITKYVDGLSYRFEPALSLSVKEAIGAPQALNFDVANACAGMMTGVAILDAMIRAGTARRGLIVSGEYITSIADNAARNARTPTSPQLASLTVGDAGAAVIVDRAEAPDEGIRACELVTLAEHSALCIGQPDRSGPGAVMHTNASRLHRLAIDHAAPVIRRALERCGWNITDVDWIIPHQTSVRAIRAGRRRLTAVFGGFARGVVDNLEEYGNTASTTQFVALHRWLCEGRLGPTDRVMLVGFASGIVIGALGFTVGDLAARYAHAH